MVMVGAIIVVAVSAIAEKLGLAAPLLLVVIGVIISVFISNVLDLPPIELEPEVILVGFLPPLLYSWAISLPTMDFRRDFTVISGFAVVLVLLTAVFIGLVIRALLPGMSLAAGIAVGAVVSPTDAVATKIVKRMGAPSRVVTVLEGEGLLNDATAMVVLRSAVAATVAAVGFWNVIGGFVWAVLGALICGYIVGRLGLYARRWIQTPALTTGVSLVVPFAAYLPAEHIGASGLVAVVVAGLVTGHRKAHYLVPRDRMFGLTMWETIETLLEGGVFLIMGLELWGLLSDVHGTENMLLAAVWLGLLTAFLALVARAAFVAPVLVAMNKVANRRGASRARLERRQQRLDARLARAEPGEGIRFGPRLGGKKRRFRLGLRENYAAIVANRMSRRLADTDYLLAKPLGTPEGIVLVFAGMRGVITLAAAQSLPRAFPNRSFVVLVAFLVGFGSLLIQGSVLPTILNRLGLNQPDDAAAVDAHQIHLDLERVAADFLDSPDLVRLNSEEKYPADVVARVRNHVVHASHGLGAEDPDTAVAHHLSARELWLRALDVQRNQLLADRHTGAFDARALEEALEALDAEQMMIEMKPVAWLEDD